MGSGRPATGVAQGKVDHPHQSARHQRLGLEEVVTFPGIGAEIVKSVRIIEQGVGELPFAAEERAGLERAQGAYLDWSSRGFRLSGQQRYQRLSTAAGRRAGTEQLGDGGGDVVLN